jgi:hypothetical protein
LRSRPMLIRLFMRSEQRFKRGEVNDRFGHLTFAD